MPCFRCVIDCQSSIFFNKQRSWSECYDGNNYWWLWQNEVIVRFIGKVETRKFTMRLICSTPFTILEDFLSLCGFKNVRLDGDVPHEDRTQMIKDFNSNESESFVFCYRRIPAVLALICNLLMWPFFMNTISIHRQIIKQSTVFTTQAKKRLARILVSYAIFYFYSTMESKIMCKFSFETQSDVNRKKKQ